MSATLLFTGPAALAAADTDSDAPASSSQSSESSTAGSGTQTAGTSASSATSAASDSTGTAGSTDGSDDDATSDATDTDSGAAEESGPAETETATEDTVVDGTEAETPTPTAVDTQHDAADSPKPASATTADPTTAPAPAAVPAGSGTEAPATEETVAAAPTAPTAAATGAGSGSAAVSQPVPAAGPVDPFAAIAAITPLGDVVTAVQRVLASVATAVAPIAQLSTDLIAQLGAGGPTAPHVGGAASGRSLSASDAKLLQLLQPSPAASGARDFAPAPTTRTRPAGHAFGAADQIAALVPVSAPRSPAVTPVADGDTSRSMIVVGTLTALVASVSLWALLTSALPGIGGLFAAAATGTGIGYRQARAGVALHSTELARFSASGPIGVVRSGTLIELRPRAAPALPRTGRPALRVLQDVA